MHHCAYWDFCHPKKCAFVQGESPLALDGPFPPKASKDALGNLTYERLRAIDAALREQWLLCAAGGLPRPDNLHKMHANEGGGVRI